MTFRATLEKVWKRWLHFTTAVKIDSKTRLEQNEAHKNLCFICGDENMDLILAPVKLQSKDLNVMLVFQLLLRARGRNHLTPLQQPYQHRAPGQMLSHPQGPSILFCYVTTSLPALIFWAQPNPEGTKWTGLKSPMQGAFPIQSHMRSGSLTARKRAMEVLSPIFFPHSHTWACS